MAERQECRPRRGRHDHPRGAAGLLPLASRAALLCAVMLLVACAGWTRSQQAMFALNVGCNAWDAGQTSWAVHNGYEESNPVYGSHPSDGTIVTTKVAGLALEELAADKLFSRDNRMVPLAIMTAECAFVVAHNYRQGARP